MEVSTNHPLIRFLTEELLISQASIVLALQQSEQTPSLLPMTLWNYGLVTLSQLDEIFDWLERYGSFES
ncbi:MAG: DUF2949 domain-containing protein [Candidatus Parcubacteria bacterium]|nr:DUF2949 domain-containing protein [Leptolyngbyaceae cyanobacterium LF-bin-113]